MVRNTDQINPLSGEKGGKFNMKTIQNPARQGRSDLVVRVNLTAVWKKTEPYLIILAFIFLVCLANAVVETLATVKLPL